MDFFKLSFPILFTVIFISKIEAQVTVVPAPNLTLGAGTSCNYSSLGNIEIIETEKNDFSEGGTSVTYILTMPTGFEIDNPDENSINVDYVKISSGGTSNYTAGPKAIGSTGGRRNRFTFNYTIASGSDDTAKFVISGLRITCYQPGAYGYIYRTGGTASQNGNAPSDQQSHGFLDSRISGFNLTAYQTTYTYQEYSNGEYSYFSGSSPSVNLTPSSSLETFCNGHLRLEFKVPDDAGSTYSLRSNNTQLTPNYSYISNPGSQRTLRYYPGDSDVGNQDYVIRRTENNCTYQTDVIDIFLNARPARYNYDLTQDTSFQQDDDPVALNDYISAPATGTSLVGIAGWGINSINSQTTFLFLPGIVKTGTVRPAYVVEDDASGCQAYYSFDKPLIVSDPLAALPDFMVASKLPPYCANGSTFTVQFKKPDDLPSDSILIGYYIATRPTSISAYNSTTNITSPIITIDPVRDNLGNNLIYYYVYFKNTTTGQTKYHPGYLTLFPERNPTLIGLPDPATPTDSIVELCSSSKDTISIRPNPSNGRMDIYKFDPSTNTYSTFALALNFFKQISGEASTNRYFIPQELFEDADAANEDYNVKFKIRYIYPGSTYGQCPDTITRVIRFAVPVEVNHTIISPASVPYCDGDTIEASITYGASITHNSSDRFYWNFGDGLSAEEDSLLTRIHKYAKPGRYLLRFKTLINSLPAGYCNNDQLDTIQIGSKPLASFDVYKNYLNEEANFVSTSTLLQANTQATEDTIYLWNWDFGNGDSHLSTLRNDTVYQYNTVPFDPYPVSLTVTSGWGCSNTATRYIPVFPVQSIDADNAYFENFDTTGAPRGWFQSGQYRLPDSASWTTGTPAGTKIASKYPTDIYWITSRNFNNGSSAGYYNNEKSWVESPVIDLTALIKPMVALDNWVDADNLFDGSALQYAICDSVAFGDEDWKTIGTTNLGLNWYNSFTVLGRPGNSLEGWTGQTDEDWKYSAFRLDDILNDLTNSNASLIRFRIVWGSNPDNTPNKTFDGFAFDNFLVGQRNRQVLVEEFCDYLRFEPLIPTTLTDPQAIRLQYHLRTHTSADEINNQNKAEPSARALLYGVGKALPRGIIDGYLEDNEQELMDWGPDAFFRRSLVIAPFDVDVSYTLSGGELTINGSVERSPVSTGFVQGPFVVQIAIVETQVVGNGITFTNVLRKMLPNSAGHRIDANYDWNSPFTLSETFSHFAIPQSDFMAVIFIQDENTKEVYQSNFVLIPQADVPYSASSLPSPKGGYLQTTFDEVYIGPNPASSELKVVFNGITNESCSLFVTDALGNVVKTVKPEAGSNALFLSTNGLNTGMYQLIIESDSGRIIKSFSVIK